MIRGSRILYSTVVLVIIQFFISNYVSGQTFSHHSYNEDESNFANPERGFYQHTETQTGTYSHLNEQTLRGYRNNGYTLILRVFYLGGFLNTPISQAYLSNIDRDFKTARAAGVKVIVRFAYTKKSTPPFGDATPEWAIKHAAQLKPVLHANADVIAVVQAGFIGAWGEWYYTDHFSKSPGNVTAEDWENRRALVNALLDATPVSRAVQLRTPAIKFSIVQSQDPITEDEAFTSESRARLGHHNDCFLASVNDVGTYSGNMEAEKAFLEEETKFLPMGGETCGVSIPLSECPNAIEQMKRFHWSYLNRGYHQEVLQSWEDGSCMPDVYKKLGYRFRMIESSLQESTKPGGVFNFKIKLYNDGWANPYNERKVELVLRNKSNGKLHILALDEDPRKWPLGDTIVIEGTSGLNANATEGQYDLFLNLPAPEVSIKDNPAYSIRLANTDVWEENTGYNNLNHTVVVASNATVPAYDGNLYFLQAQNVIEHIDHQTDGSAGEWQGIEAIAASSNDDVHVKMFNDADSIYFLIEAEEDIQSFELFVDHDGEASGELVAPWNSNFADIQVTEEAALVYNNGEWITTSSTRVAKNGKTLEVSVANTSSVVSSENIQVAFKIETDGGSIYVPAIENNFISYDLMLISPDVIKATSSGEQVILYWAADTENALVIERSVDGSDFVEVATTSSGIITTSDYVSGASDVMYRAYRMSDDGLKVSPYSNNFSVELVERPKFFLFDMDGDAHDWNHVAPVATHKADTQVQAFRAASDASNLYFSFEAENVPEEYQIYFDADQDTNTGADANNDWMYEGFDYLVQNDSLFNIGGELQFIGKVISERSENFLEVRVSMMMLSLLGNNLTLYTGAKLMFDETENVFPDNAVARFDRLLPTIPPANVSVSNSTQNPETELFLQWEECLGCSGFVIERSIGEPDNFQMLTERSAASKTYIDRNLTKGTVYYYRVFAHRDGYLSNPSDTVQGTPTSVLSVDPELEGNYAYPNPTDGLVAITLPTKSNRRDVTVLNAQGQSVSVPVKVASTSAILDFTNLPKGVYHVRVLGKFHTRVLRK